MCKVSRGESSELKFYDYLFEKLKEIEWNANKYEQFLIYIFFKGY